MNISFWLNGAYRQEEIEPGMLFQCKERMRDSKLWTLYRIT